MPPFELAELAEMTLSATSSVPLLQTAPPLPMLPAQLPDTVHLAIVTPPSLAMPPPNPPAGMISGCLNSLPETVHSTRVAVPAFQSPPPPPKDAWLSDTVQLVSVAVPAL